MDPADIPGLAKELRDLGVTRFRVDGLEVEFHTAAVYKPQPTDSQILEAGELNAIRRRVEAEQQEADLELELLSS